MGDTLGFVCGTCGLSDLGITRLVALGFDPHPCKVCSSRFVCVPCDGLGYTDTGLRTLTCPGCGGAGVRTRETPTPLPS